MKEKVSLHTPPRMPSMAPESTIGGEGKVMPHPPAPGSQIEG